MYNYFVLHLKLTQYCKYLYSNKKKVSTALRVRRREGTVWECTGLLWIR